MVGRAQGQVSDEADDGLDQRPTGGRVHQPDDGGQAALEPHRVLTHLALGMSRGQVPEGAHGRLGDFLPVSGSDDGADESLDPADGADDNLVLLVVAGQVAVNEELRIT